MKLKLNISSSSIMLNSELTPTLRRSTMVPVQKVLDDAGMKADEIDEIVLVGGSTRIPKVHFILIWIIL